MSAFIAGCIIAVILAAVYIRWRSDAPERSEFPAHNGVDPLPGEPHRRSDITYQCVACGAKLSSHAALHAHFKVCGKVRS